MSKYLTTICLILGSILPIVIDTGQTHLLNPDWDEHARVHEVWRLSTNLFIALVGMYILWVKNYLFLAGVLSSCILLGFHIAALSMPPLRWFACWSWYRGTKSFWNTSKHFSFFFSRNNSTNFFYVFIQG